MKVTINMNDTVEVKLRQKGREILRDYHESFYAVHTYIKKPKFEDVYKISPDGFYKTQLWNLFEMFGEHVSIGSDIAFETEIRLVK